MTRQESFFSMDIHTICMHAVWASVDVIRDEVEDIQLLLAGDDDSVEALRLENTDGRISLDLPVRDRVPNLIGVQWMHITLRLPQDWKGALDLHTTSGNLNVRDVDGTDLCLETVSGNIRAAALQSMTLELGTVSGLIFSTRLASNEIKVHTVSGSIQMLGVTCPSVHVNTITANCVFTFDAPFEKVDGNAVSGSISLTAPVATVNAVMKTVAGRLLTKNVSIQEEGPSIRLTTVSGSLELISDLNA